MYDDLMKTLNICIAILFVIFIVMVILSIWVITAEAATASIPWRFYQLYENQALEVNCKAESMSTQQLDQQRVLILCGVDYGGKR